MHGYLFFVVSWRILGLVAVGSNLRLLFFFHGRLLSSTLPGMGVSVSGVWSTAPLSIAVVLRAAMLLRPVGDCKNIARSRPVDSWRV